MTEFECYVLKILIIIAKKNMSFDDQHFLFNLEKDIDEQLKWIDEI